MLERPQKPENLHQTKLTNHKQQYLPTNNHYGLHECITSPIPESHHRPDLQRRTYFWSHDRRARRRSRHRLSQGWIRRARERRRPRTLHRSRQRDVRSSRTYEDRSKDDLERCQSPFPHQKCMRSKQKLIARSEPPCSKGETIRQHATRPPSPPRSHV